MRARELLHNFFNTTCKIDKRIKEALFAASESLLVCKNLSVNALGRSLSSPAKVKHCIKRIDRLFGNETLHEHMDIFYKIFIDYYLKNNNQPVIIVDGSGLTPCGTFHFLRAAIPTDGRTLTLYDEVHTTSTLNHPKTHLAFLKKLKELIPAGVKPIIVTDAGFRNTWFNKVCELGWDYVGRIRHQTRYKDNEGNWQPIKTLYSSARLKPTSLGQKCLAKSNPLLCHFYLIKQQKKYRTRQNLAGKKIRCSVSLKHAKRGNEPWLIASSMSSIDLSPNEIILIYKKRMQIEEAFRDLKNTRNGLGLRHCRSTTPQRLSVALLIANLGTFVLRLFGLKAIEKKLHYSFQSNTEKNKNVLSNVIIGWQLLQRPEIRFKINDFNLSKMALKLTKQEGKIAC
jgi:hypothetical protein